MARPTITDVRSLSDAQIAEQIDGVRRELFDLRFQQATRRLEHPHRFKESRIKLAHLLTVQEERQRSTVAS
ncbi:MULTISPECIES: 50S ribosomal protein L29 [Synechococcales]|jgi:large subunit ribosomal protein L29|uniref:50S ribosomal protein L29 n=1 Tax=Synechococcales TaxID=1890424 RepID=UPI000B9817F3|nr:MULTISPECIES: 50S ribosomal protein L29 [Synechococcales]MBD2719419.1 50S ribosomal protein L29 [Synechococcus sp. FACHB-909]MCP9901630.1 50S ribosomal protein L29 [Cyanobium sp. Cruz CV11-17]MCP9920607.1 50S ribosomal protein L29 [Cyanobium sp. Cruz CV13-4-11]MCP9931566.1 50S ribosomal protein L29 [Cyanobium sp. AMD-g]